MEIRPLRLNSSAQGAVSVVNEERSSDGKGVVRSDADSVRSHSHSVTTASHLIKSSWAVTRKRGDLSFCSAHSLKHNPLVTIDTQPFQKLLLNHARTPPLCSVFLACWRRLAFHVRVYLLEKPSPCVSAGTGLDWNADGFKCAQREATNLVTAIWCMSCLQR